MKNSKLKNSSEEHNRFYTGSKLAFVSRLMFVTMALGILIWSCSKDNDVAGVTTTGLEGEITGSISLKSSENGMARSDSGVAIYLKDSIAIIDTSITDKSGAFKFTNVKAGNYTLLARVSSVDSLYELAKVTKTAAQLKLDTIKLNVPVAYLHFDSASFADNSEFFKTAIQGDAKKDSIVNAPFNPILSLSGTGYLDLGYNVLDGACNATVAVYYLDKNDTATEAVLIGAGDSRANKSPIIVSLKNGLITKAGFVDTKNNKGYIFSATDKSGTNPFVHYTINSQTLNIKPIWNHFAMTLKKVSATSSQITIYLNGLMYEQKTTSELICPTYDVNMKAQIGAFHGTQIWNGAIDEVGVVDTVASEAQVKWWYSPL